MRLWEMPVIANEPSLRLADAATLLVDSLQKQEDGRRENRRVSAGDYPTIPSWGYRALQPEREIPLQTRCRSSGGQIAYTTVDCRWSPFQERVRRRSNGAVPLALSLLPHHFVIIPQPAAPRV
jgi:hypothetical protein